MRYAGLSMAGFISSGSVSEGQKNKAMKKRDWVIIGCIIVGGIVIACLINWSLTYGSWIKTNLSIDSRLSFWGSYCGGIFAAIVGYLAIIYSNRNSEKAIHQQEKQLIHQRIVKKLDEYNDCLKNNLELLNIVDIMGITVGIDYQNLSLIHISEPTRPY